ncbi:MAG: hypothetical protein ACM358_05670, partial [Gemmatimonadota bacterium]
GALTRADLDKHRCSCPDDAHHSVGLGPTCHRDQPVTAHYTPATGRITLKCSVCKTITAVIQVAGSVPS